MPTFFPDDGPIRFNKSRDAGSVINATVVFIRQNARELLVGFFALVIPFALAAGVGVALFFRRFGAILTDPAALENDPTLIFDVFGPSYLVLILGSIIAFSMAHAAIAAYVRLYREGEVGSITVSLLWDEAKGLILPVMGMYLLLALVIIVSGAVAIIPCLGAVAWLAFMVWMMPYVHVMYASRMTESETIGEAWSRARHLVAGSWAGIFGTLLLAWVIGYVVILALSIPLSILLSSVLVNSVSASTDPTAVLDSMAYTIAPMQVISIVAYLLPAIAAFFVHGRLVDEVDGAGVEDDLDIFDRGVQTAPNTSWDDVPPARGSNGDAATASGDTPDAPTDGPGDAPDTSGGFRGGRFGA